MVNLIFTMMNGEKLSIDGVGDATAILDSFDKLRGVGFFFGKNMIVVLSNVAYIQLVE